MSSARLLQFLIAILFFVLAVLPLHAAEQAEPLPGEGKKCAIGSEYSFVYQFDQKPQLGVLILKIRVADKDGKLSTTLRITGDSGIPLMQGHHASREKEFMLNKKGYYLLPVDVVMPGAWEVKLAFCENGKVIYRGRIRFDI